MIAARLFNTPFAEVLFGIAEDSTNGFRVNHLRMQIFLSDLNRKIEETNKLTLEELKNEEAAVANNMMKQPDIDAQLNHFTNILCKGLVVGIYSYMESKMHEIELLCSADECWSTSFKPNNRPFFKDNKLFKSITKIANWVLAENVQIDSVPQKLKELSDWVKLRNDIVHNNGDANNLNQKFLDLNGISIEFKHVGEHRKIVLSELTVKNFNDLVANILTEIVERISVKQNSVKTVSIKVDFKNKKVKK